MYMGFSVYLHYKTFNDIQEYSDKISELGEQLISEHDKMSEIKSKVVHQYDLKHILLC